MRRIAFSLILLTCSVFSLFAKKPLKPKWLMSTPQASNATYVFVPISVDAGNITEGRNSAMQQLVIDRNLLNSLKVQTEIKTISNIHSVDAIDGYSETSDFNIFSVTTFSGDSFNLKAQIVDYFYEPETHTYSSLYRVALVNNAVFDRLLVSSDYGFSAGFRSMLIPGWGQMYKGATAKGVAILGGIVLFAGGVVFTETSRSNFISLTNQTHDINLIRQYSSKAQNMSTIRNVCIGALGALYLYNVIDAIASHGAKRIIFLDSHKAPFFSVAPNQFGGMSLYASAAF
jgi:hypothetical protein